MYIEIYIYIYIWEFLFCSFAQIGLLLSAHMELLEPHMELHMELHMGSICHMETSLG